MKAKSESIKLLVLHNTVNEAELLTNILRNDGKPTHAHHVTDFDQLHIALKNELWDICFAKPESNGITVQNLLLEIKRLQRDIPVILLIDENEEELILNGLKVGCADVIPEQQSERLLLVTLRELTNLAARRNSRLYQTNLREVEKRARLLLDSSRDAITYLVDGVHIYSNEVYLKKLGFQSVDDIDSYPILDLISPGDQAEFKVFLKNNAKNAEEYKKFSCKMRPLSGDEVDVMMEFSAAFYDGEPCTQAILRTSVVKAELHDQLQLISSQDIATGLFNRQHFSNLLDSAIERAHNSNVTSALVYMQIDHFYTLKSQIGIANVDNLLSQLAMILKQYESDDVSLARFGDCSFTFLVKCSQPEPALKLGEDIREKVQKHIFEVSDNHSAQTTASFGVTMVTETTTDGADALSKAYEAYEKVIDSEQGGNGVNLYAADSIAAEESLILTGLQEAIDNDQFKLLYQAIISLKGDERGFYELFLRMINENDEEISPTEFIAQASQAKLVEKIDRLMILQALTALSEKHAKDENVRIIMNLGGQSATSPTLLSWLEVTIKAAKVAPGSLIFQIPETDINDYLKHVIKFFNGIRQLGVKSSISRFGLGVNPENMIKQIKPDFVKLDGSFTLEVKQKDTASRIKSLASLAEECNAEVISPFVESAAVLSSLWQLGVHYVQGYYLHAPNQTMDFDFTQGEE